MIAHLSKQVERGDDHKSQLNAFFSVLEERFLDINPYCRCRAIQVYIKLCDLDMKFPKRRLKAAELADQSLEDKSSNVRRNAIKLLGCLIKTHPFTAMHGSQLSRKDYQARLDKVEAEIGALKPPEGAPDLGEKGNTTVDPALLDDATQLESPKKQAVEMTDEEKLAVIRKAQEEAATSEAINKLTLTKKYYSEALKFIDILHEATTTICQLLGSKNKSEVIEAMDYFEIGDAYNIEQNKLGIRRMLRLIWTKANSDEGKGVQTHLIECYKRLFFEAPDTFSPNDAANYIARNMISLTFGATPAELTSLEQLLATMMKDGMIHEIVVAKLWQVYGVQRREISRTQRRGAIMVLGMLATANPEIVVGEMETMLRTGLGPHGRADLQLAKYTCIALRRINPIGRQAKDSPVKFSRLPNDHAVLTKLAAITEVPSDSKEWLGVAEQAISAIYAISKHPDVLCSEIIRRKTRMVFSPQVSRPNSRDETQAINDNAEDAGDATVIGPKQQEQSPPPPLKGNKYGTMALSQLLFIVGHVAIKQIVHLELCELDFKRRKQEKEKGAAAAKSGADDEAAAGRRASKEKDKDKEDQPADELDLIGGTSEDDFTEAMQHIRERELLYGPNSLLGMFGPLVSEICANNTTYRDKGLQAAATLCLAKLMCVSSEYCETNLPLLITIMERSADATVRSNAVIALGDMAVCFNHLIDENTDFLYRRLADSHASVKRTCLMTLTFLILAGQVKVKGQLGEMAKCLEDNDRRIADLARMFFTELSTKDNAVYNHFVDMFSLLSAETALDQESFRRIVRFLLGFVEKVRCSLLPLPPMPLTTRLRPGQIRPPARRKAGCTSRTVRHGETVGRRCLCAGAAAAQERRHRQVGVGGVQDGAGAGLRSGLGVWPCLWSSSWKQIGFLCVPTPVLVADGSPFFGSARAIYLSRVMMISAQRKYSVCLFVRLSVVPVVLHGSAVPRIELLFCYVCRYGVCIMYKHQAGNDHPCLVVCGLAGSPSLPVPLVVVLIPLSLPVALLCYVSRRRRIRRPHVSRSSRRVCCQPTVDSNTRPAATVCNMLARSGGDQCSVGRKCVRGCSVG